MLSPQTEQICLVHLPWRCAYTTCTSLATPVIMVRRVTLFIVKRSCSAMKFSNCIF